MNNDVYHATIVGVNPHDVARNMAIDETSPFYEPRVGPCVASHIIVNDEIVGGIVEVWGPEHLSSRHEEYLQNIPNVIDVKHVYPE